MNLADFLALHAPRDGLQNKVAAGQHEEVSRPRSQDMVAASGGKVVFASAKYARYPVALANALANKAVQHAMQPDNRPQEWRPKASPHMFPDGLAKAVHACYAKGEGQL